MMYQIKSLSPKAISNSQYFTGQYYSEWEVKRKHNTLNIATS